MRRWRARFARLVAAFRPGRHESDRAREIEAHLALHTDDNIRAGMTPAEARRRALLTLGGIEQVREACRDRRGLPWLDTTWQDVRHAGRQCRREPGFAAVAVLSLALGIGANTAVFTVLNGVALQSLPVAEPHRLVQLYVGADRASWTNPLWEQIRDRPELFDGSLAWSNERFNLASGGEADHVPGLYVSGRFFATLGVPPLAGRLIDERDDQRGGGTDGPVAVLSSRFWHRRYQGSRDAIGATLVLQGQAFTIVGVTPPSFHGPEVGRAFDVAIPIAAEPLVRRPRSMLDLRTGWWLRVFARLKPTQTEAEARAALAAVTPQIREATLPTDARPESVQRYLAGGLDLVAAPNGPPTMRRAYGQPLFTLLAVMALVLLIACANLANLWLSRTTARRREFSLRVALGASRARVVRQMLIECALVSAAGTLLGLYVASWGSRALVAALSARPGAISLDVSPDWRVLLFASGIALLVTLICGAAPARRASRMAPAESLRDGGRLTRHEPRFGASSTMVVAQVALSLTLVAMAALFVRTFASLATREMGFDGERLLVVALEPNTPELDGAEAVHMAQQIVERVRQVPGVDEAALSAITPASNRQWDTLIDNPPGLTLSEEERAVWVNAIGPGWFATYGTALVAGRDIDESDTDRTRPIAVVNESAAQRFFPHANPVGQFLRKPPDPGEAEPPIEIVGVVEDAVYDGPRDGIPPTAYVPLAQEQDAFSWVTITVRAAEPLTPASLTKPIVAAIGATAPGVSVTVQPLAEQIGASIASERTIALLTSLFGALGLVLAGIGLYGVVSYGVNRRQAEIGVRLALGATKRHIVRLVLRRVAWLVLTGIGLGLLLSAWASRLVESLLFGVAPRDPLTLAAAAVALVIVGGLAGWVPAHRAMRIDPTVALRND